MNTTIDLKTAKTIEAMNQKVNHMDTAVPARLCSKRAVSKYLHILTGSPKIEKSWRPSG